MTHFGRVDALPRLTAVLSLFPSLPVPFLQFEFHVGWMRGSLASSGCGVLLDWLYEHAHTRCSSSRLDVVVAAAV